MLIAIRPMPTTVRRRPTGRSPISDRHISVLFFGRIFAQPLATGNVIATKNHFAMSS